MTPEELAYKAKQGSKASFTQLVTRFGPRLYSYFYCRIPIREDCEDLVQETFIKAYKNIRRFDCKRAFKTWLYTIGARLSVDYIRADKRRQMAPLPEDAAANRSSPFEEAVQKEKKQSLWSHARALPQKQYDALWLRYMEDMPVKQIAQVLGASQTHVKVMLFRARIKLAEALKIKERVIDGAFKSNSFVEVKS